MLHHVFCAFHATDLIVTVFSFVETDANLGLRKVKALLSILPVHPHTTPPPPHYLGPKRPKKPEPTKASFKPSCLVLHSLEHIQGALAIVVVYPCDHGFRAWALDLWGLQS